jgi:AcrR family transcriptional regulator
MGKTEKAAIEPLQPTSVAYATRDNELSRVDRRTARTRRSIFAALEGLSSSVPLAELSVARVAEAADINRVTFYAHFRNLDDLLDAALLSIFDEAESAMAGMFVDDEAFEEVGNNVRTYAATLVRHKEFLRWVGVGSSSARLIAHLGEAFRIMIDRRIDAARPACASRRRELFSRYMAGGLANLVLGLLSEDPSPSDIDEIASFLPEIWLPSSYIVLGIGPKGDASP